MDQCKVQENYLIQIFPRLQNLTIKKIPWQKVIQQISLALEKTKNQDLHPFPFTWNKKNSNNKKINKLKTPLTVTSNKTKLMKIKYKKFDNSKN